MNNVALYGRLVRDPELRYTNANKAYVRITVAVDRRMSKEKRQEAESKNQPTADFISCVAWERTAETIANYFKKGSPILIEGRIQTGSYTNNEGRKVYTTDVVVNNFFFTGGGQGGGQRPQEQRSERPTNSAYNQGGSFGDDDMSGFYPVDDEEIPF